MEDNDSKLRGRLACAWALSMYRFAKALAGPPNAAEERVYALLFAAMWIAREAVLDPGVYDMRPACRAAFLARARQVWDSWEPAVDGGGQ
jgi:hypothetical protein